MGIHGELPVDVSSHTGNGLKPQREELAGCCSSLRISLFLRNSGLKFSNSCPTPLGLDVHGGIFYRTLGSTDALSLLPLLPPAGCV